MAQKTTRSEYCTLDTDGRVTMNSSLASADHETRAREYLTLLKTMQQYADGDLRADIDEMFQLIWSIHNQRHTGEFSTLPPHADIAELVDRYNSEASGPALASVPPSSPPRARAPRKPRSSQSQSASPTAPAPAAAVGRGRPPRKAARITVPPTPKGEPTNRDILNALTGVVPAVNSHADMLDDLYDRVAVLEAQQPGIPSRFASWRTRPTRDSARTSSGGGSTFSFLKLLAWARTAFAVVWLITTIIMVLTTDLGIWWIMSHPATTWGLIAALAAAAVYTVKAIFHASASRA